MGNWSVAIVDSGVTDETEAVYGVSLFDYDYFAGETNTDGGRLTSHGSRVATSIEMTNSSLERLDLQISSDDGSSLSTYAIYNALHDVGNLDNEGWSIGAVNMSFGSSSYYWTSSYQSQISLLYNQGVYSVASSGNSGSTTYTEYPAYPARLSYVISVGSHDGEGNPSWFSQNYSGGVHILADGENYPGPDDYGTSFAAPQVSATVATVQALAEASTGTRLSFDEVIEVLQQGGNGPTSATDPANGTTTYFLHDHDGSVNYVLDTYVDPVFSGLEYIATYSDIEAAFGRDADAARDHFVDAGVWEGRVVAFDGLEYIASYDDLRAAFGTDREAGTGHYLDSGRSEGRAVTFDAEAYLNANPDLDAAFHGDHDLATLHYITAGVDEGRATEGDATTVTVGRSAVSEGATDLPRSTATEGFVGIDQSVTGTIGYYGDRDWFETELTAGQTVVIEARGASSGGGSLYDPELYVRDALGGFVTYNWDSGLGWDAYLAFTPSASGTYFLEVDGYSYHTGTYTLEVSGASNASLTELAAGFDAVDRFAGSFEDVEIGLMADSPSSSGDPFGLI